MEVTSDSGPADGHTHSAKTKDHDFNRRGILSSHTEWGRVLVVNLVDVLVERSPVKCAVHPVVPRIFKNEENCNLICHLVERREWYASLEAKVLGHRVEEPDLRKFDSKVAEEDELCAIPLFRCSRYLLL